MEKQSRFDVGMGPALFMAILLLSVFDTFDVNGRRVADTEQSGFRADLVHVDSLMSPFSPGNISYAERIQRAIYRSKQMVQRAVGAPVIRGNGEFLMKLAIGTPALPYYAILDTGSDVIWTQCQPCVDCYKQRTPIYNPNHSSTYSKLPCQSALCKSDSSFHCGDAECEYEYYYAASATTSGNLSYETFTFVSKSGMNQSIPHIAFGCSTSSEGDIFTQAAGIVGFGRGPVSLISQLPPSTPKRFSYCLLPIKDSHSKSSPLMFGNDAKVSSNASSTHLIKNSINPSFYYLTLEDISVGNTSLHIPDGTFDIQPNGNGGMLIDSGTTTTFLDPAGYDPLEQKLLSLINLSRADGDLDLCFVRPSSGALPNFPTITFHFRGADYPLTKDNYMITDTNDLLCLAILSDFENVFGNVQQQYYTIWKTNCFPSSLLFATVYKACHSQLYDFDY